MALLHRVWRSGGGGGLSRLVSAALLLAAILSISACRAREAERNANPPDSLLQASLGLTDDDHVHRILLTTRDGREVAEPTQVTLEPGAYVEFFTGDRHVRTVSFLMDSLTAEQADFLRSTRQDQSPPLLELETRFVVSFVDAPLGRYPFVVDGNQRPIRGALTVAERER